MRVMMVIRPDADTKLGGDRIQMIETAKNLRLLGVDVLEVVGSPTQQDFDGVDVVHLFNLQTRLFSLEEATRAKANGKPLALSTIWWEPSLELIFETSRKWGLIARVIGRNRAMKVITKRAAPILAPDRALQSEVTNLADVLLPNSWAEARELRKLNSHDRVYVVPNGVDIELFDPVRELVRPDWVPDGDYILCAARIERLKGQLGLARAAKNESKKCVLVGDVVDPNYADACRAEGAIIVDKKGRNEIAAAFKYARLYVQPSLRETPGLAALEAASMDCPVAVTKHGSTTEYFANKVSYLDPFCQHSIESAISSGLLMARGSGLSEYVRSNFPWKRAADATLAAYRTLC